MTRATPAPARLLHPAYVHERRTNVLADWLARLLPAGTVLDVGAGDGLIARKLAERRPDLQVRAVEVLVRGDSEFPVEPFDGRRLELDDGSLDAVTLVDVLHHATDPRELLAEAARVARSAVVVKDVTTKGLLARETLHFMERVANTEHGISIPDTFWAPDEWREAIGDAGLGVERWETRLGLYPFPASLVFERSFHFVAKLVHTPSD